MLDAIPCSFSDCYANNTAKTVAIAINSDGELLNYDGSYFKRYNNAFEYVANHNLSGDTYTTIQNYAIKPSGAYAFAFAPNVWYNNRSTRSDFYSQRNYCTSIGWRLPNDNEVVIANGVPEAPNNQAGSWTSSGKLHYTSSWYAGGVSLSHYTSARCVK